MKPHSIFPFGTKKSNPPPGDGAAAESPANGIGIWRGIGTAVIFLAFSTLISTAMTLGVLTSLDKTRARHAMEERHFYEVRDRYRQLDEEMAIAGAYFPRFQHLVQTGFIGEERRLTWLEALRNAASRIGLTELTYNISSRRPHSIPDFPVDTGPYGIHASEMQLTMGLLHEQDLFSLLAELDRHAVGLYNVEYCRLRRVERESWRDPARANLNAECVLRWYSLER